jgi:hypothetical protein
MDQPERAGTCSCFLQQFENTVVLRRTFIHLISTHADFMRFEVSAAAENSGLLRYWHSRQFKIL